MRENPWPWRKNRSIRIPNSWRDLTPSGAFIPKAFIKEVVFKSLKPRRSKKKAFLPVTFPRLEQGQVAITWIGHASFLIQFTDLNILIDPIFTNWLFLLRRLSNPGIKMSDLPCADMVLISHAHFDHFHKSTLKRLPTPRIAIVPWSVGQLTEGLGFERVIELEWWESFERSGCKITFTPAKHWGARYIADVHRGYGGFVIEHQGRRIYHVGDSAYFEGFTEVRKRLKPEIALIPIGAYAPEGLRNVHMGPPEAIKCFKDLNAKIFIPMHYGTFKLSFEEIDDPPRLLQKLALQEGLLECIHFLQEGIPTVF